MKQNRRSRFFTALVFFGVVFLGVTQLLVSNYLANLGEGLKREEEKIQELNFLDERLKKEIAQKKSLINLAEEAQKFGFEKESAILYLTPQIPVAMK